MAEVKVQSELTSKKIVKKRMLLLSAVLLVTLVSASWGQETKKGKQEIDFEVTADFFSKYIWRGQNLDDDPVFQSGISASYKGLIASVWGNLELTNINGNSGDFSEVDYSLAEQEIDIEVFVAESGEDAFEYLSRSKAGDDGCPKPNLVLLDLNMPGMGGKEFLRHIKADEGLDAIPVVILTTSDSEQDVIESYKLYASGYVKKPVNPKELKEVMHKLGEYWFAICEQV